MALAKSIHFWALKWSITSWVARFWWVTYKGIITRGILPLILRTLSKAWGSKYILNYAAGVILPFPIAPPIITIF